VKLNEVDETQIEIQANPALANVLTCKYNYGAIVTV
jgi:predicted transposase YbfD/YdcC